MGNVIHLIDLLFQSLVLCWFVAWNNFYLGYIKLFILNIANGNKQFLKNYTQ